MGKYASHSALDAPKNSDMISIPAKNLILETGVACCCYFLFIYLFFIVETTIP